MSLTPARQCGCWRAVRRKGCSGSASRLDLHWVHPQESCGSDSFSLLWLWFLAGNKPGKYSLCSFFRRFARENSVAGRPEAGIQVILCLCCWSQLHDAASHCTCLCLSSTTAKVWNGFELLCWAYASLRSSAAAVGFWKLLGRPAWCDVALGLGRWHQFSSAAVFQMAW